MTDAGVEAQARGLVGKACGLEAARGSVGACGGPRLRRGSTPWD
jgi:hypothetical protein